MSERTLTI